MLTPETILNDRYHLQEQLSQNPVRQTWLAQDLLFEEKVVIKLLQGGATGWQDIKLFEREAQILQQLDHPHIPQYRDYFALDEQTLWFALVTDHISGDSLKNWLDQGYRFSPKQIGQIAEEVLTILDFLHGLPSPVLHRDIKPSNLMWSGEQQVYLIDFGSVQSPSASPGSTFTVVGTYGYTPLEQFGGKAVPGSDLYALGATLIHLLTGIAPADLPQKNLQLQFHQYLGNQVETNLVHWLEKLTQPSLEKRFSTVQEALEALRIGTDSANFPALDRMAFVSKSSEQLVIEIPSPLEIDIIRPLNRQFNRFKLWFKPTITRWVNQVQALSNLTKRQISRRVLLILAIFLILDFLLDGALGEYISALLWVLLGVLEYMIVLIIDMIVLVIMGFLFLGIIAVFIIGLNQRKYRERIRIYLDHHGFEIQWRSPEGIQRERGKLSNIDKIFVTSVQNLAGNYRSALMIVTKTTHNLPFFGSRTKEHLLGHQLKVSELNFLVEEIQEWLNNEGLWTPN